MLLRKLRRYHARDARGHSGYKRSGTDELDLGLYSSKRDAKLWEKGYDHHDMSNALPMKWIKRALPKEYVDF